MFLVLSLGGGERRLGASGLELKKPLGYNWDFLPIDLCKQVCIHMIDWWYFYFGTILCIRSITSAHVLFFWKEKMSKIQNKSFADSH